jgi:uncharacterized OB-fold protein
MHPDFPLPDVDWPPARPFWDGAAAGELRLPRCPACGRIHWYPEGPCRRCGAPTGADADAGAGSPLRWEPVSGRGTLFSWSVVTQVFLPQFRDLVPVVPALVAVDEDPDVRLVTRVVDADPADLRVDQPVRVVFRPLTFAGVAGSVAAPLFVPA